MPEILKSHGVHTHLATDHYHYIQDGGATYCGRYSTWECYRGQESDEWIGDCTLDKTGFSPNVLINDNTGEMQINRRRKAGWQNYANRQMHDKIDNYRQSLTYANGLEFIDRNASVDNWFVQIETFDPHEPFTSPEEFHAKWFDPDNIYAKDWPPYAKVSEDYDSVQNMRKKYYALAEYCDYCLGLVLDKMDELNLWEDTMLIVNTDHGFFLGEHDWWGKGVMPDYEELTHTPLFIWDPRAQVKDERRSSLVQTIDIAPTLLSFFGIDVPVDMIGKDLAGVIAQDDSVREYAIYGYHGGAVNITDGRFVLMRSVQNSNNTSYEYTLMPMHMKTIFSPDELKPASLAQPFGFTKECPLLKIPNQAASYMSKVLAADLLFDLQQDGMQQNPIEDIAIKHRLLQAMRYLFEENEAPEESYIRYAI
jgi:arylsulfatase A-like enzyme